MAERYGARSRVVCRVGKSSQRYSGRGHRRLEYDNIDAVIWIGATGSIGNGYYVQYEENIYVGYRYYETRFGGDEAQYAENVVYPFGYGLSYTQFERQMGELVAKDGTLSVDITVTNTGSVAGKDVVQLYATPPYSDGGIEKSAVNLMAFGKTPKLVPGERCVLTLTFGEEDMASYDYLGEGCYVLDAGEYILSLRNNAHDVISSASYTVENRVVDHADNARSTDRAVAVNRFDEEVYTQKIGTQLSRADWEGTFPRSPSAEDNVASQPVLNHLGKGSVPVNPEEEFPVLGASKELSLSDMRGASVEDERWEALLDQLTLDDMLTMQGLGGYGMSAIESVGKPETVDYDGPQGLRSYLTCVIGAAMAAGAAYTVIKYRKLRKEANNPENAEGVDEKDDRQSTN